MGGGSVDGDLRAGSTSDSLLAMLFPIATLVQHFMLVPGLQTQVVLFIQCFPINSHRPPQYPFVLPCGDGFLCQRKQELHWDCINCTTFPLLQQETGVY